MSDNAVDVLTFGISSGVRSLTKKPSVGEGFIGDPLKDFFKNQGKEKADPGPSAGRLALISNIGGASGIAGKASVGKRKLFGN